MLPEAYVCHQTFGRIRIRVPEKKGDTSFFSQLREGLGQLSGVERVDANALTGGVLLLTSLEPQAVGAHARENGLFQLRSCTAPQGTVAQRAMGALQRFNTEAQRFTGGELDLRSMVFVLLIGVGLYQIIRGDLSAPLWHTAFWYALGIAAL